MLWGILADIQKLLLDEDQMEIILEISWRNCVLSLYNSTIVYSIFAQSGRERFSRRKLLKLNLRGDKARKRTKVLVWEKLKTTTNYICRRHSFFLFHQKSVGIFYNFFLFILLSKFFYKSFRHNLTIIKNKVFMQCIRFCCTLCEF